MHTDKTHLAKLLSITTDQAATILARACERGEIYGREFLGGIKYEVDEQWLSAIQDVIHAA